jgi:hypothetical protein
VLRMPSCTIFFLWATHTPSRKNPASAFPPRKKNQNKLWAGAREGVVFRVPSCTIFILMGYTHTPTKKSRRTKIHFGLVATAGSSWGCGSGRVGCVRGPGCWWLLLHFSAGRGVARLVGRTYTRGRRAHSGSGPTPPAGPGTGPSRVAAAVRAQSEERDSLEPRDRARTARPGRGPGGTGPATRHRPRQSGARLF